MQELITDILSGTITQIIIMLFLLSLLITVQLKEEKNFVQIVVKTGLDQAIKVTMFMFTCFLYPLFEFIFFAGFTLWLLGKSFFKVKAQYQSVIIFFLSILLIGDTVFFLLNIEEYFKIQTVGDLIAVAWGYLIRGFLWTLVSFGFEKDESTSAIYLDGTDYHGYPQDNQGNVYTRNSEGGYKITDPQGNHVDDIDKLPPPIKSSLF